MSVNKQIIVGRLGKDPESRSLDSGVQTTKIVVATDFTWKDKSGERQSRTTWHNVVFWRGQAEVISKFFSKGDEIYVEGRTETRSYTDKDGNEKWITEVIATDFSFIGSKKDKDEQPTRTTGAPEIKESDEEDDLPF
jgi:single-strand DNA-binding protein